MARVSHPEFGVALGDGLAAAIQAGPIQDFVQFRVEKLAQLPVVCRDCRYAETCATRCPLTWDQTKYYKACEALVMQGEKLFPGCDPKSIYECSDVAAEPQPIPD